jgi:uncharacterized protein (UPF0332 family)
MTGARRPAGAQTVEFLIERGRLERIDVTDRLALANSSIGRASRRVGTAKAALELGDVEGAYTAAYDSYRIAAESLLLCQGLRATAGDGSHLTVEDAASAQFAGDISAFAKPTFERLRRTRHAAQYFDPSAPPITLPDAQWAIDKASTAVAGVEAILATSPPDRFA